MIDPKKLEEIAKQVHNSLPPGIRSMGEEVEKKIRQVLQSQLGKLEGQAGPARAAARRQRRITQVAHKANPSQAGVCCFWPVAGQAAAG